MGRGVEDDEMGEEVHCDDGVAKGGAGAGASGDKIVVATPDVRSDELVQRRSSCAFLYA